MGKDFRLSPEDWTSARVLESPNKVAGFVIQIATESELLSWARQPGVNSALVHSSQSLTRNEEGWMVHKGAPEELLIGIAENMENVNDAFKHNASREASLAHVLLLDAMSQIPKHSR